MPLNKEIKPNQTIVIFVYLNRFYYQFQFDVQSRKGQWQKLNNVLEYEMFTKLASEYNNCHIQFDIRDFLADWIESQNW